MSAFSRNNSPGPVVTLVTAAALMLIGVVAAFGTAPQSMVYRHGIDRVVEEAVHPASVLVTSGHGAVARELKIQSGDTAYSLLSKLHLRDEDAAALLRGTPNIDPLFRQFAPGKTITAMVTPDGGLTSLLFPLNSGKDMALHVARTPTGFSAQTLGFQLEKRVTLQSAVIRHSLFGAADDAGIPDGVALLLVDIFSGDIDFHKDLRKGDRFSVIYETTTHMGKPIRTDRVLAAEFVNGGKTFSAFWYQKPGQVEGYYTAEGRSIKKAFLRSPLEFSRVTSGFTNARYHPVLKEVRAHRGIDYGAPTGTKVMATGDGIVEFSGNQGGYGKVVMVRHPGSRLTVYGHLSAFAENLKKGARVKQGGVIGYVGATGLASGPHLHYEFRVDGIHRDPLAVALPAAPALPASHLADFKAYADSLRSQLDAIGDTKLVLLD